MTSENKLAADILETIEGMLARPKMYASTSASLEEQFFSLFVLVAPYHFGMTLVEAVQQVQWLAKQITGNACSMSSVLTDIDDMTMVLRGFYGKHNTSYRAPEDLTKH